MIKKKSPGPEKIAETTVPAAARVSAENGERTSSQSISVVLAEHQDLVRMGLRLLLHVSGKVEVIGEATDGMRLFRSSRN